MLLQEVKDPRIGFVSVTRVEVTRDLSVARAYVSILGTAEETQSTLCGLKTAAPFLRGEVGRRLGLRKSPELVFREDRGIAQSMHIQGLIRGLDQGSHDE